MKKMLAMLMALAMSLSLVACSGASSDAQSESDASEEQIVFKMSLSGPETHQNSMAAQFIDEELQELSDGRMRLELFYNGVLGNDREVFEGIVAGSVDMTIAAVDAVDTLFVPDAIVCALPYLFATREEAYDVLDNFLLERLQPDYADVGVELLGFCELGYRHFTNNVKPIETAADMEGMVIRVQESPIWSAICIGLNVTPQVVAFNELYTALQQGVVDGQENPLGTITSMKYYEVQDYVTLDGHVYAANSIILNQDRFADLSEEDQAILVQAVTNGANRQREALIEQDEEYIAQLEEAGVEVVRNPDVASFQEALKDLPYQPEIQALFNDPGIIEEVYAYMDGK